MLENIGVEYMGCLNAVLWSKTSTDQYENEYEESYGDAWDIDRYVQIGGGDCAYLILEDIRAGSPQDGWYSESYKRFYIERAGLKGENGIRVRYHNSSPIYIDKEPIILWINASSPEEALDLLLGELLEQDLWLKKL